MDSSLCPGLGVRSRWGRSRRAACREVVCGDGFARCRKPMHRVPTGQKPSPHRAPPSGQSRCPVVHGLLLRPTQVKIGESYPTSLTGSSADPRRAPLRTAQRAPVPTGSRSRTRSSPQSTSRASGSTPSGTTRSRRTRHRRPARQDAPGFRASGPPPGGAGQPSGRLGHDRRVLARTQASAARIAAERAVAAPVDGGRGGLRPAGGMAAVALRPGSPPPPSGARREQPRPAGERGRARRRQ
jgi:hypothetical protein